MRLQISPNFSTQLATLKSYLQYMWPKLPARWYFWHTQVFKEKMEGVYRSLRKAVCLLNVTAGRISIAWTVPTLGGKDGTFHAPSKLLTIIDLTSATCTHVNDTPSWSILLHAFIIRFHFKLNAGLSQVAVSSTHSLERLSSLPGRYYSARAKRTEGIWLWWLAWCG